MIVEHEQGLLLMRGDQLGERNWRSDDCYKLIFSPFGTGIYQTPFGDVAIGQGSFFIFNPADEHKQVYASVEKLLIEVKPSLVKEAAEQLGIHGHAPEFSKVAYRHPQLQQWITFVREYFLEQRSDQLITVQFLDHCIAQLAILMVQYGTGSHTTSFPSFHNGGPATRVMDALKQSYTEEWTLAQMAEAAGVGKFQFAHLFKEETGISPYSWLQLYRLFRSQHALLHTKRPVLSIALDCGFTSAASYNLLFKKIYQKTPTEFRRIYGIN
ncbi:AraC family transcriptional regulator [Halobacillus sp. A5]|uniref:AraC family transcriptional regulator n=1 Tax=Halobacillus sp. A5 TaxID=2880263 RepID=UPI0020A6C93A|nr:AraC family transcriptional regulator [Halobacillus sp. A5]MCP3026542.1 AraC family transcriptional regulator [Halobacillus sp. A5]